ncbi:NADPH:quinone reductase [Tenacibaculum sp. SG-28]|uniref:NADPH:quinone reductase n=1 Tax=Tenacibaculum sp. SG-28 TaxID=754426 RepID=UPI000CF3A3B1|nr:NADPH:quinone reductase [Tenacibaculum sp. SG-28]PQJ20801.1 zinc-binding dehydrogenase [Tenacibaculum sp. SG-28]
MKAAWFEKFGTAEEVLLVGEYTTPEPKAGEVKIRIKASGVNPSDTKKRAGANPALLDNGSVIPHSDGSGVIEAVGIGVSEARIGERVWTYNAQYGRNEGTAAEFVCLPAEQAVVLPDNASFEAGAMMAIPAMTAHRAVFADGAVKDQIILVTGGAGRVGYYAIQWAKASGATVIATASSNASIAECERAGADLVVGHPSEAVNTIILDFTKGRKIDRVVEGDFGANLLPVLDILKTSGIIASYSSMTDMNPKIPFVRMMFMDITIRLVLVYAMPESAKQAAISDITTFLTKGALDNRIAATYTLDEIAKAHETIEAGNIYGTVLVTP